MLEAIRNNKDSKLAKIILAIIIVPFALFGIDSYLSSLGTNAYVAKVNGKEISLQQYQRNFTTIREQLADPNTDPSMFDSPEFKSAVLDNLISAELVNQAINDFGFVISDQQLREYIVGMPDFQVGGMFSQDKYDEIVRYNNISPKQLEEKIRADLAGQQIRDSLKNLVSVPGEEIQPLVNLAYQKRDINLFEMYLDDYEGKIKPTETELQAFYDENTSAFIRPDQVKINFIIYSVAGLVPKTKVSDAEVREFFEANKDLYQGDQQRRAKHILFSLKSGISDEEKIQIKDKALLTLNELRKDPKLFDAKAKDLSQDPESAKRGGDLGFFSRGSMVKPFEDQVFSMEKNEISDIVETSFGYHIIMLTDIKGEEVTFDSVQAQIKGELLYGKALEEYANNAEEFNNTVYENSTDLEYAAKKYGLEIQSSEWLSLDDAKRFFNNDAFANSIFSQDSIDSKKNIAALEVSPNNLVSARVIDFRASGQESFENVKDKIKTFLVKRDSQKLIIAEGNQLVEDLRSSSKKVDWVDKLTLDRVDKQGLPDPLVNKIFQMDATTLPAYEGFFDTKGEYYVIKLNQVIDEKVEDELSVDLYRDEYEKAIKEAVQAAYIDDLRSSADIEVNTQLLN